LKFGDYGAEIKDARVGPPVGVISTKIGCLSLYMALNRGKNADY
jgi:hypothetical protein